MKSEQQISGDRADFLSGGGEMGERMRVRDWSQTPFGPVEDWPGSLKTSISIILESRFAMVVAWGPEFRLFYNDRYRPVLGASKHPGALGAPAEDIFPEAWPYIGPLFENTRRGESVALDDVLIPLDRYGYLENCYFTLSYSPIRDETGGVGGMLAVVAETTERVEGERRLKTLRELARRATEATAPEQACESAASTFSENPIDVPFAFLYLLDSDRKTPRLVASTGANNDGIAWPIAEVAESRQARILENLPARFPPLSGGPYPEPAHTAIVLPLARPGLPYADAVLVCGVSPRRALNDAYRGFFDLAADHILTAIRNALSHQEQRQRAEKLAELDRAKTDFFSNVSHEFRTPLTLMLGPLEEVLGTPQEVSEDVRGHVESAHRNCLRLLKLVNTLLDFSRIEAGRIQAVYEPTDLSTHTSELASVFRSTIEKAGLEFIVNCSPIDESVYVDHEMWEKIVFNLLSNAFKFTFEGRIEIGLSRVGQDVTLHVTDTGTGIPPEELPHLFERFHRVKGARGRTYEGTGIGLALVRELVLLHGGAVRVASDVGGGTTFTVSMPLGRAHLSEERIGASRKSPSTQVPGQSYVEEMARWHAAESIPATPRFARSGSQRARVLLADDNADMRDYVTRLLAPQFDVLSVSDGQAALEFVSSERPDLIISDVMMPRLDGVGLLQAIRNDPALRTIPVILLSARAGEESRVEGLAAGADDYLVKPFSARELIARVETHLRMTSLRRETELRNAGLVEAALKARSDAEQANRLKDEFLATVSHELRTPLNAMLGWARLLRTGKLDEAKGVQAIEVIERNALSQQQIIEDILDVSRIITGNLRLQVTPIDLSVVIESAIDR